MTLAEATARAGELRVSLLDHRVKAVSIELLEGRSGSGYSTDTFVASLGHHIVSSRAMGLTPGYWVVRNGRVDLPGPLCNGYGGFDEQARIVCMAWANHPGEGGPFTFPSGTVPKDNGRPYLFGWEFEGGIDEDDFTDSYRVFMARCLAGTLDWLGLDERSHAEHKDWAPDRKVDRLGYTRAEAQAEIATELNYERGDGEVLGFELGAVGAPVLPYDARGEALQRMLNKRGADLTPDGLVGDATRKAYATWQTSVGITDPGSREKDRVGPRGYAQLNAPGEKGEPGKRGPAGKSPVGFKDGTFYYEELA